MTLPTSGALSLSQVNTELGLAANTAISLNQANVRSLAGVASGAISMSNLYGKANEIRYINTANRTGASIFELMGSPTQPGTYVFENQATISAGTGSYALRTGVFPAGSTLHIVNKGMIQGRGGAGGNATSSGATVGSAGGVALHVDYPCTTDNSAGYIFGGGGGGGGTWGRWWVAITESYIYGYAGGGGGQGASGGAAGTGRGDYSVIAQGAGTGSASGSHGRGATAGNGLSYGQSGAGGDAGTSGGIGSTTTGYTTRTIATAGAAGAAIAKNGKTVTITAGNDTNRIKGAIV